MKIGVDQHEALQKIPVPPLPAAYVNEHLACPCCGEIQRKSVVWLALDMVRCTRCGTEYRVWIDRSD